MNYFEALDYRRLFLNIGLLCLIAAAMLGIHQLYEDSFLRQTVGTVTEIDSSGNHYDTVIESDGTERRITGYIYSITYKTESGREYAYDLYGAPDKYDLGQSVDVQYDLRHASRIAFFPTDHSGDIKFFLAAGAVLVIICCKGFSGYVSDFIKRYPKAFIFTLAAVPVPTVYYYVSYENPKPQMMFEGLGEALTLMFLMIAVPVSCLAVWLAATVSYYRKSSGAAHDDSSAQ